jgi:plasmid stability protein
MTTETPRGAIIAIMSQLIVRNVPPRIVKALKQRAARAGRSAEAEHRVILETALAPGRSHRDFKTFLKAMPDLGPVRLRRARDVGRPVDL